MIQICIFKKIKKFLKNINYNEKKAYLYNEYKIGNNVKPDIKQTNKNIELIYTPKEKNFKKI